MADGFLQSGNETFCCIRCILLQAVVYGISDVFLRLSASKDRFARCHTLR